MRRPEPGAAPTESDTLAYEVDFVDCVTMTFLTASFHRVINVEVGF